MTKLKRQLADNNLCILQSVQVQDTCQGTATLPTYSPVGIFVNGRYVSNLQGGIAGIFLGCENGGFKVWVLSH